MRLLALITISALFVTGCRRAEERAAEPPAAALQSIDKAPDESYRRGRTYVPIYSSIHWGFDNILADLACTLSVRNVSATDDLILESISYFDSSGKKVRQYVDRPSKAGPLLSLEFVIARKDRTGGTGASFLVDWAVPKNGDDPLIEAVMVGQQGNAGISFSSPGRVVQRSK